MIYYNIIYYDIKYYDTIYYNIYTYMYLKTLDAQFMVCLPTSTIKNSQMKVNMPHIECLGTF